jgi:glycosyltransferase involved in cell wall biosynthesis
MFNLFKKLDLSENKRKKPIIMMDLSSKGRGGGPFTSTSRIMNSNLKDKYEFIPLNYNVSLGRGISIARIMDLKKQLKRINPDIVHFTGLQLSGFHIIVACKLAGIKNTIVTVRGFSGESIEFNPLKRFILTFLLEPITLLLSKCNYGVSKYVTSRNMMKLFRYKSFGHIYNFPPNQQDNSKNSIREELKINDTDIIVVSVARINKEKGYHVLEKTIKKFDNIKNIKFIIIGNGDYLETMKLNLKKQMLCNQVNFLGYRDDIQNILKECNIFVLPTLHETLSVALLEASKEKLPLIASNVGGVPEIIEDCYNGFLVEPNNYDEIYSSIMELYKNYSLRKKFGNNAFLKLNNIFNGQLIENKIDTLYKLILSR